MELYSFPATGQHILASSPAGVSITNAPPLLSISPLYDSGLLSTLGSGPYTLVAGLYNLPTLNDIFPHPVHSAGGTTVYLKGTNLSFIESLTVDGTDTPFTVLNDDIIMFFSPAHLAGNALIEVTDPAGLSANTTLLYTDLAPTAPQGFTATPGQNSVTLGWQPPAQSLGGPILDYDISSDNGVTWTTVNAGTTSYTFANLVPGRSYTFRVGASNADGYSPEAVLTVSTLAPPQVAEETAATTAAGSPQTGDDAMPTAWLALAAVALLALAALLLTRRARHTSRR